MTTKINPIIDDMLNLTADIAEELLRLKDAELGELPDGLKLKIISLAELAATPTCQAVEENAVSSDLTEVENEHSETVSEVKDELVSEPESEPYSVTTITEVESVAAEAAESAAAAAAAAEEEEEEEEEPISAPQPQLQPQREPAYEKRHFKERQQLNPADLQRVFSINDEFLFCREIFKGEKSEYLRALDYIAKLPNRWALQVFLVEELGLNLNESPGKEFYQTLVVFFK